MRQTVAFLLFTLLMFCIPVISAPQTLKITKVGEWVKSGVGHTFVKGNYAYCGTGTGIAVLDISNPLAPREVGACNVGGGAARVQVSGNYAYVIGITIGLQIIDVSNPFNPVRVSGCDPFVTASDMYVNGNYAYVEGDNILKIIDVSDPGSPILRGSIKIEGMPLDIFAKGDYVYLGTSNYLAPHLNSSLHIVDVSDPDAPQLAGVCDITEHPYCGIYGVQVSGNYAYLVTRESFIVVDVSDPTTPRFVTSRTISILTGLAAELYVLNDYAYIAVHGEGLKIMNISNPSSPIQVGSYDDTEVFYVYTSGQYAYVSCTKGALKIYDVSAPASPSPVSRYDYPGSVSHVFLSGNYAYLLTVYDGLKILDTANPYSPTLKATLPLSLPNAAPRTLNDLHISGDYAYVAANNEGLKIVDISNPSSPTVVGNYTIKKSRQMDICGNYVYLAVNDSGLMVIDVSDPSSPVLKGKYESPDHAAEVHVGGNHAYLSYGYKGLKVIDISDPASPQLTGQYDSSPAYELDVSGDFAYITDGEKQFSVLDISSPSSPTLLGSWTSVFYIVEFHVKGNYAYLCCESLSRDSDWVQVLDVSNPKTPILVGQYKTPGSAEDVDVSGNFIYVADGSGMLQVLQYTQSTFPPVINVNPGRLTFAAYNSSPTAAITVTNSGEANLNWSASTDRDWLRCIPTSGRENEKIYVSTNISGLSPGTYSGNIILSDSLAANSPKTVSVTLNIYQTGQTSVPFGEYATPIDGSVVSGSVPFTGWVLDEQGMQSVQLFREAGNSLVYIGDAVFVEGARPDVEEAYPGYPNNEKAGWGYMMLTNFLPNGNGSFTIHAIATDIEGNQVTLGSKSIIVDNANAVEPFGTIDTPEQGGTAGGNEYVNFGWALTPMPNTIPTDGSTIGVWVDGKFVGNPVYNRYREDIALLFPGYNNSNGAGGYFYLDTTGYADGVHTIAWSVEDNAGNSDGIGSRYFSIQNGSQSAGRKAQSAEWLPQPLTAIPPAHGVPVRFIKGYSEDISPGIRYPDQKGIIHIETRELERVEIHLQNDGNWSGFQVIGNQFRPLPVGSFLDRENGIFYWQPGVAFVGRYWLVFIHKDNNDKIQRLDIRMTIKPKSYEGLLFSYKSG